MPNNDKRKHKQPVKVITSTVKPLFLHCTNVRVSSNIGSIKAVFYSLLGWQVFPHALSNRLKLRTRGNDLCVKWAGVTTALPRFSWQGPDVFLYITKTPSPSLERAHASKIPLGQEKKSRSGITVFSVMVSTQLKKNRCYLDRGKRDIAGQACQQTGLTPQLYSNGADPPALILSRHKKIPKRGSVRILI